MVGRFIPMRKQLSFDVVEAQRAEAMRMGRIKERAARATPQREVQPQVQREVRQAAPPLQLTPQRYVDSSEIATAITGRGPQGLDTSYTVNLQPDSQRLMSNRVIPEYRVADKQQYLEGVGNAPTGYEAFIRNNPNFVRRPKEADFPMKGMPAVEMRYGRVTDQNLPIAMEKQGSYYTAQQLGQGASKPIGVNQVLNDYETAMDSFAGSANDRFMRGNPYNGYEPVHANEVGSFKLDPSDTWIGSNDPIATARYSKSERNELPLISINSQGKAAPVPQSDEATSTVIPVWNNGMSPEYANTIPQRLTDAIDKNVMATRPSQNVTEQMISEGVPLVPVQNIPESTPLRGSPSTLREQFSLGASPLGRRELVTGTVPSAFQHQDGMNQAIETAMAQQQQRGGYAMTTLPDENSLRLDREYQNNPLLQLPSTVIADRGLSPYKLTYGSEVIAGGKNVNGALTAASSVKADLGGDERLGHMLRSQPIADEVGRYIETSPGYVKYTPKTQTIEHDRYTEPMTDAQNVRDRIASQAKKMDIAAVIQRNQAQREAPVLNSSPTQYPVDPEINAYLQSKLGNPQPVQVMRDRYSLQPIVENTPEVMSQLQLNALRGRGDAMEMQQRLEFTDNAIADAYAVALNDSGVEAQKVGITMMKPDGSVSRATRDLTFDEQVATGENALAQGYGRLISNLAPGNIAEPKGIDVFEVQNRSNNPEVARQYYLKKQAGQTQSRQSTPFPIQTQQGQVAQGFDPNTGLPYNTGIQLRSY